MMAFYIFFAGIHLIMVWLQNTLAIVDSHKEANSHHGIGAVKKCPVITFSIIFILLAFFQIVTAFLSMAQIDFWSFWWSFQLLHNIGTVRAIDYVLYGMAALTQIIKIANFLTHCGEKNKRLQRSASHKCMSLIGLLVSIASLVLISVNLWLLSYYQRVGDKFLEAYNILAVVVMIPLLHYMIL